LQAKEIQAWRGKGGWFGRRKQTEKEEEEEE